jgi:hypothetical protein
VAVDTGGLLEPSEITGPLLTVLHYNAINQISLLRWRIVDQISKQSSIGHNTWLSNWLFFFFFVWISESQNTTNLVSGSYHYSINGWFKSGLSHLFYILKHFIYICFILKYFLLKMYRVWCHFRCYSCCNVRRSCE